MMCCEMSTKCVLIKGWLKILGSLVKDKLVSLSYWWIYSKTLCWTDTQWLWSSWSQLNLYLSCLRFSHWMLPSYQLFTVWYKDSINSVVSVLRMEISQDNSWNIYLHVIYTVSNPKEQKVSWIQPVHKENLQELSIEILSFDLFPHTEPLQMILGFNKLLNQTLNVPV